MAEPLVASVTVDGEKFRAMSATVAFSTESDHAGMPMMGTFKPHIEVVVDLHDVTNMPFSLVRTLFDLAKLVTREKVKEMKIEFWQDEHAQDVICSYSFRGWISHWHTSTGGGSNHILILNIQPALDQNNFCDLTIGN